MHDRPGSARKRHDVPSYRFTPSPPLSTAPTIACRSTLEALPRCRCGPPPCAAPCRVDDLVRDQPTRPLRDWLRDRLLSSRNLRSLQDRQADSNEWSDPASDTSMRRYSSAIGCSICRRTQSSATEENLERLPAPDLRPGIVRELKRTHIALRERLLPASGH